MVLSCVTACAVVAVEIGDVNLAVAAGRLDLEGDLGLRDAFFAGDGLHDVVGKRVRLPPQRRAVVGARQNRVLGETVHHAAHHVAGAGAADLILRGVRRHEREALDVKVKFQNLRDLAAKAFEGNGNGLGVAQDRNLHG